MSLNNVKDIYPLSPIQQGILFHTLYSPGAGEYIMQMVCTLRGTVDASAFERAWQRVVDRHEVLRTAFVWEGFDEPLQIVRRKVRLPWEQRDLRANSAIEQEEMLQVFFNADRQRGFELTDAPLMRCTLIRTAEDTYKIIWSYHHLLLDGWCLPLIMKEVALFYETIRRREELELEPARPFRDYIAWLQKRDLTKAEFFWRHRLKGYTAPVPLPGEAFPGSLTLEDGCERDLQLSASATEALQTLARQQQMTLYNVLQGAWALLLSRYSGEDDVVFGVTVSGRPTELTGVESMVGLFINTLPVRVVVSPDMPLLGWLKNLQREQLEAQQYEYSPLNRVQKWSDLPPSVPLFESILVFENYMAEDLTGQLIGGVSIIDSYAIERTNYPLTISIRPGARLALRILYDAERFSAATIDRILMHLRNLLESFAQNPGQLVSSLNILSAAEREQQLVEWNNTRAPFSGHLDYPRLFEEQVALTPDAVAVVDEHERLTYQELNRRANQLAHLLREHGVGPESLVGIFLERSAGMVVALLAILKAGGAYVPLDPQYPRQRLAFMLEDSGMRILVTQQHLVKSLPKNNALLICLDSDREAIAGRSEVNPKVTVELQNLAYVIYTSGSTGQPKGVQICRRALVNFLYAMRIRPGIDDSDILLSVTTLSFDIAGLEIYLPLIVGARLVMANHETARDTKQLARLIDDCQATLMQATPTTWRMLMDVGWQGREKLKMLCGGEGLSGELAGRLIERGGELWNMYGPTETTVWSSIYRVEQAGPTVPIGRPIANTSIYILDKALQLIPSGAVGEVYIGGEGLARGYWGRVEMTAEAFIPDAQGGERGARLYRTGDVGRYLEDGNIEYLGRSDHQVKVRGFRIELGEIEAVLSRQEIVKDVVVVAREDAADDKRIVAYVVLNEDSESGETGVTAPVELRKILKSKLPEYMMPSAFVELAALPLTPNGKVDRRALAAPDQSRPAQNKEYVAPRTETEEAVALICGEVIRLERVGVHDNFFELGGHSLMAMQVVSRVREAFQVEVTLRDLFENPTVAQLCEVIMQARSDDPKTESQATPALLEKSYSSTPFPSTTLTK
jgi:amino acid adenylation domain-containing protein